MLFQSPICIGPIFALGAQPVSEILFGIFVLLLQGLLVVCTRPVGSDPESEERKKTMHKKFVYLVALHHWCHAQYLLASIWQGKDRWSSGVGLTTRRPQQLFSFEDFFVSCVPDGLSMQVLRVFHKLVWVHQKNSRRLELSISKNTPPERWGQGPGQCGPKVPCRFAFPSGRNPRIVAFHDSGKIFQQFPHNFPRTFLQNSRKDPRNSHSLLEYSECKTRTELLKST